MKKFIVFILLLLLVKPIFGMESGQPGQPPSLEVLEEIIKAPGTAFEDELIKDLQSTAPAQIPQLIQQLDYSITNLSPESSNKIRAILENLPTDLQIKIFKDLLDAKEWQLAVTWTGWINKTKGEFVSVLQPYITKLIREKNISALGTLIILIPDKDPLNKHVELAIKDFMAEKAQRGEYAGVFEKREAGFKTLEEQDREVNEAIGKAKQNPSGANLELLRNLEVTYHDNPIQGPKLRQAIQELVDIMQKRGARVEPVSPAAPQEVGDITLLVSGQEVKISKNDFKKLVKVSQTIATNLEDLATSVDQLDEFTVGPVPVSSFQLIINMLDELVGVKEASDDQAKTQAEANLVVKLQAVANPKERIELINTAEFLEITPLLEYITILAIPKAFKDKQEYDDYLAAIKKIPQNSWDKILQKADLHYEILKHNLANKKTKVLSLEKGARSVQISPDSKYVVQDEGYGFIVWNVATGVILYDQDIEPDKIIGKTYISPNGKMLITSTIDIKRQKKVIIWDLATGNKIYELMGQFSGISLDNKYITTSLGKNKAIIWDLKTGQRLHEITGFISDTISPSSKFVVTQSDNKAIIWDLKTGQRLHELIATSPIEEIIISPDSKYVITQLGKTVIVWSAITGKQLHDLGIQDDILGITISSNNKFLLTELSQSAIIWNVATGKKLHTLPRRFGKSKISPNSKYVITLLDDILTIWDLVTGDKLHTLTEGPRKYLIEGVKFTISNDSKFIVTALVSGTDENIAAIIWDLVTGNKLGELKKRVPTDSYKISPDNNFVVISTGPTIAKSFIWQLIDPTFKIEHLSRDQIVFILYLLGNKQFSLPDFMQPTYASLPAYLQQLFPVTFVKTAPSIIPTPTPSPTPPPVKPTKPIEKPIGKPKSPKEEEPIKPKTPKAPTETPLPPKKPTKPTPTPTPVPSDLPDLSKNLRDLSSRLKRLNEELDRLR